MAKKRRKPTKRPARTEGGKSVTVVQNVNVGVDLSAGIGNEADRALSNLKKPLRRI